MTLTDSDASPSRLTRGRAVAVVVAVLTLVSVVALTYPSGSAASAAVGTERVAVSEVSQDCGLDYETSGNADGSDDGGVAVADYDRDGWPDLLAIGGGPVLYRNTGGEAGANGGTQTGRAANGTAGFEPSDALPELEYPPLKTALFFDADGDGWSDLLLVPRAGHPILLENDRGEFDRADAGFDTELQWGTGAAAADYDGDGDLDLFLTQNGNWRSQTPRRGADGQATDGFPNLLYENVGETSARAGNGTADIAFERAENAGVGSERWSLATTFTDLTGDGHPDIHVANDYARDALLVNRGDGTFVRREIPGTNRHGMASVVRDVTGDGRLDLFVSNIEFEAPSDVWELNSGLGVRNRGNTLLVNRGNGTFVERADDYGIRQGGWGWAAALEDFDNDGTLDLLHATKFYLERTDESGFTGVETRPSLWEGRPNGTFESRDAAEAGFVHSNGRGLATLDFDRDGDRDIVVADTSGRFKLYRTAASGNWLQVRVRGAGALGARVHVETTSGTQTRVQSSRSDLFSQSSRTLHFGLGPATVEGIRVVRTDGTTQTLDDPPTNRRVTIWENGTLTVTKPASVGCRA